MKKTLLLTCLALFSCLYINEAKALTQAEADEISEKFFENWCYFTEGEKAPKVDCMMDCLITSMVNSDDDTYLLSKEGVPGKEYTYNVLYRVPAEVFEEYVEENFFVTSSYIEQLRESFNSINGYDYKEIEGKYYYEFTYELIAAGGWGTAIYTNVKGYKDLGNNYYEFYIYDAALDENYVPSDDDILDQDHVNIDGEIFELFKAYRFKVYYTKDELKFASKEQIENSQIAKSSELILYEDLLENETSREFTEKTTSFDISKDEELKFSINSNFELFDKVFVDGKEVDKEMYEAKSGSTIISFKEDYIKNLTEGEHTFKTTFKDGSSAETKFTVQKSVVEGTVPNPDTGLFTGLGLMGLIGALSAGVYVSLKRKNKFIRFN